MPAFPHSHGALTDFGSNPCVKFTAKERRLVEDVLFLGGGLAVFALMALYAFACERM
jgi:hypothetical protein